MTLLNKKIHALKKYLLISMLLTLAACGGGAGNSDANGSTENFSPPTSNIISFTPTNSASKVPVSLNKITVNFNKAVNPSTLNSNNFIVSNGVTGTLTVSNNNTRAVFTPTTGLSANMNYTVTLNGITDFDGNSILPNNAQTFSWTFSTCGNISSSNYTISWDQVTDADLTGYRVYYGLNTPLTKSNSSFQDINNSTTSWNLIPSNQGFKPCETVYIAISSIGGTKGESPLSLSSSTVID